MRRVAAALQVGGAAVVVTAAGMLSVTLGVFAAGVALVLFGVAVERDI